MWQSLSITKKIWLSISILIFGYFLSMVFGFVRGNENQKQLHYASEYLFPSAIQSQLALSAFKEQI